MGYWNRLKDASKLVSYCVAPVNSAVYSGFEGFDNLGDEALIYAIRKAFHSFKLYSPPRITGNLFRPLVSRRRHSLAILGGGTLIGADLADGSNPFRELFSELRGRSAQAIVFGTGVGALSADEAANSWLQKWQPLLQSCRYIGVRGPASVRSLASVGIQAELIGDPACLLACDSGFWAPVPKALGVSIGAIKDFAALETISRFVAAKIKEGWNPTFFVVSPEDAELVRQWLKQLGSPKATCHFIYRKAQNYLAAVRSMSVFVGIRLHSVILALCAGVPSLMLAYAPKCHDFMASVDMQDFVIDIQELNETRLTASFEKLMSGQLQINKKIVSQMTQFRDRLQQRADGIQAELSNR